MYNDSFWDIINVILRNKSNFLWSIKILKKNYFWMAFNYNFFYDAWIFVLIKVDIIIQLDVSSTSQAYKNLLSLPI